MKEKTSKTSSKGSYWKYRKSTWRPYHIWWAEKQAAEKAREERRKWEDARDERMQIAMEFKERAEDFCSERIVSSSEGDILQLRKGDDPFKAYTCIASYEQAVALLGTHIQHLEYDPRIVAEMGVHFCATDMSESDRVCT